MEVGEFNVRIEGKMNLSGKKISIIIPVYQTEKYLRKCLRTVSDQSYKNIEIFLIDDGSTDASKEICDEMAKMDDRFIVIHQKNQGVSFARNVGLDLCTGDYVMFVDADDWLELDCCERAIDLIRQNDSDICFFEMYIERTISEKTFALKKFLEHSSKVEILKGTVPFKTGDSEDNMVFYGPYCKLFKREKIGDIRYLPELKYGEDAIFNMQVILKADSFCFDEKPLYHYRKNDLSVTASFKEDRVEQSLLRLKYTEQIIQDNNLNFLNDDFRQMFINLIFWLINNLFRGRKTNLNKAWSMFQKIAGNKEMRTAWSRMRYKAERIKLFDAMFLGNIFILLLAFLRLRYIKNS